MKMVKKHIAELEGAQLDWAVAMALGIEAHHSISSDCVYVKNSSGEFVREFMPCKDWSQGGPIIEREDIWLAAPTGVRSVRRQWSAAVSDATDTQLGRSPLIAAMRAFVASRIGDEVEVPE